LIISGLYINIQQDGVGTSLMQNFSDNTLRILKEAGWFLGRSVSTDVFEAFIARDGFYPNDTIRNFLREFGGLTLKIQKNVTGTDRVYVREIQFGTINGTILGQVERIPIYESILGDEILMPIGCDNQVSTILMSYAGSIYISQDESILMMLMNPHAIINFFCEYKPKSTSYNRIKVFEDNNITFSIVSSTKLDSFSNLYPKKLARQEVLQFGNKWHKLYGTQINVVTKHKDTPDEAAQKIQNFLNDFIKLNPLWSPFYALTSTQKRTIGFLESPSIDDLKEIIVEGQDETCSIDGCKINFSNQDIINDFRKVIDIRFQTSEGRNDGNWLWMRVPPMNDEATFVTSKEFIMKSFELFLKHWQPTFGRISLSDCILNIHTTAHISYVGWLTFLSNGIGELSRLPDWAKITPADNYGTYIQVSEELPDPTNESEFRDIVRKICELSKIIEPWIDQTGQYYKSF
jgi:hypothetical protein